MRQVSKVAESNAVNDAAAVERIEFGVNFDENVLRHVHRTVRVAGVGVGCIPSSEVRQFQVLN